MIGSSKSCAIYSSAVAVQNCSFLVITHVMRRPYWCTKQRQNVAQVWHNNRIKNPKKTFFATVLYTNMVAVTSPSIVLYTNMAAVTSHEKQEFWFLASRHLVEKYLKSSFSIIALNSTSKPRCRGCTTGFFCPGNGTEKRCGEASPTEFSFGLAASCSACPEGWVS